MMGSHADSVPTGGKYDGQLGVLCALEVIRTLNDREVQTRHPVAMAIFTNEEGARFQPAMIGSGVMAGKIPLEDAYNARDRDGLRLGDELERIGYLGSEPCIPRPLRAYLELHIEQGPILEEQHLLRGRRRGHRRDRLVAAHRSRASRIMLVRRPCASATTRSSRPPRSCAACARSRGRSAATWSRRLDDST